MGARALRVLRQLRHLAVRFGFWLRRRARALVTMALAIIAVALVVFGLSLIYPPAGFIAAGLAVLAILTFNPTAAGRLTWPR